MDTIIIILILLGVAILYFATRFLGKTFKIITKIMLLLVLVLMVLTLLIYKDMADLKRGFAEQNNTFLLYDNNKLYSGIILKPMQSTELTLESFGYLSPEEIQRTEQELNNQNYDAVLGNNYRILIVSPDVINKSYSIKLGIKLDQDDLLDILLSEDSFKTLAEKAKITDSLEYSLVKSGFEDSYGNQDMLKGYLFAALLGNYFMKQGPNELVRNVKQGDIIVYPETISFKIIKYIPWV